MSKISGQKRPLEAGPNGFIASPTARQHPFRGRTSPLPMRVQTHISPIHPRPYIHASTTDPPLHPSSGPLPVVHAAGSTYHSPGPMLLVVQPVSTDTSTIAGNSHSPVPATAPCGSSTLHPDTIVIPPGHEVLLLPHSGARPPHIQTTVPPPHIATQPAVHTQHTTGPQQPFESESTRSLHPTHHPPAQASPHMHTTTPTYTTPHASPQPATRRRPEGPGPEHYSLHTPSKNAANNAANAAGGMQNGAVVPSPFEAQPPARNVVRGLVGGGGSWSEDVLVAACQRQEAEDAFECALARHRGQLMSLRVVLAFPTESQEEDTPGSYNVPDVPATATVGFVKRNLWRAARVDGDSMGPLAYSQMTLLKEDGTPCPEHGPDNQPARLCDLGVQDGDVLILDLSPAPPSTCFLHGFDIDYAIQMAQQYEHLPAAPALLPTRLPPHQVTRLPGLPAIPTTHAASDHTASDGAVAAEHGASDQAVSCHTASRQAVAGGHGASNQAASGQGASDAGTQLCGAPGPSGAPNVGASHGGLRGQGTGPSSQPQAEPQEGRKDQQQEAGDTQQRQDEEGEERQQGQGKQWAAGHVDRTQQGEAGSVDVGGAAGVEEDPDLAVSPPAKVRFSVEELENLVKGVSEVGTGSWKVILQRHHFHPSRDAGKLKDKWRNLVLSVKKNRRERLEPVPEHIKAHVRQLIRRHGL